MARLEVVARIKSRRPCKTSQNDVSACDPQGQYDLANLGRSLA
jgi:hypothetical protein